MREMAEHFAGGVRHPEPLAKLLGLSARTVRRHYKTDAFHEALDALGYTGDRSFTTKTTKPFLPEHEKARQMYDEMTDIPKHKRLGEIAKALGLTYQRIHVWHRKWQAEDNREPVKS